MRDDTYTPFTTTRTKPSPAMRVLHRFHKPDHVAEIRERRVTQFRAIEFVVFVDGQLHESQMFHGARLPEYPSMLAARCAQFVSRGWIEDPTARPSVQ